MADHNDFGKRAENAACEFLEINHYVILERNFCVQKAEIDIIAEFENKLIIVEVKARSSHSILRPEAAVDYKKRKRLIQAADAYCQKYDNHSEVRFDIISIIKSPDDTLKILHLRDAFNSSEI